MHVALICVVVLSIFTAAIFVVGAEDLRAERRLRMQRRAHLLRLGELPASASAVKRPLWNRRA